MSLLQIMLLVNNKINKRYIIKCVIKLLHIYVCIYMRNKETKSIDEK